MLRCAQHDNGGAQHDRAGLSCHTLAGRESSPGCQPDRSMVKHLRGINLDPSFDAHILSYSSPLLVLYNKLGQRMVNTYWYSDLAAPSVCLDKQNKVQYSKYGYCARYISYLGA